MVSRIRALDPLTIDKIAAGEVIDFPASCVKELVDNALDAGATRVIVEVDVGGRERIVVTDDGCGMSPEDVLCCIQRHTTSKLCAIEDLSSISSRGFRGEALASMVAVSRVTITSAEHSGSDSVCPGTILTVAGGEVLSCKETLTVPGTAVCVESLFYNVPARRKFLKSPSKDSQDIVKMLTMLAFSSPDVSFRLILDGKLSFAAEALQDKGCYADRAKQVFSELFSKNGYQIEYVEPQFCIRGMLASLQNTRPNRSLQYLLINGRPVMSPGISYIVKAACGTAIEQHRHPIFALSIDMDQSMLDINAHPQKREVRFADEESVRSALYRAVLQALFSVDEFGSVPPTQFASHPNPVQKQLFPSECTFLDVRPEQSLLSKCTFSSDEPFVEESFSKEQAELPCIEKEPICLAVIGDIALVQPVAPFDGQDEAIIALDLRATMRALLYKQACSSDQSMSSQTLLIPITLQTSADEQELVHQAMPRLKELGFLLRSFGQNSYLIETAPAHLPDLDIGRFVLDALHSGVLLAHDMQESERARTLAHLQTAAMKDLKVPISREFAVSVYKSWMNQGRLKTAPDGSFCYASITPKSLKSSIAKGNLLVCRS